MKGRSRKRSGSPRATNAHYLQVVRESCEQVLVPLSRQLLDLGLGVGLFLHAAKRAYVSAAMVSIRKSGQRPTVSRIAAMTGLQRKEIRQLIESVDDEQLVGRLPPTAKVVAAWCTDSAYLDSSGKPAQLRIEGGGCSFRELARRYAGDVTHVSLLRELERLGWVRRVRRASVALQWDARRMEKEGNVASNFASQLSLYATALVAAKSGEQQAAYVGYREAGPLDGRLGAALARTFARRADEFLGSLDRWVARAASAENEAGAASSSRYGVGVYLIDKKLVDTFSEPIIRATPRAKRA